MTYRIEISRKVNKQLKVLPVAVRSRIQTKLKALGIEPRPPGVVKLKNSESQYRIRVGNYRVIYEIEYGSWVSLRQPNLVYWEMRSH